MKKQILSFLNWLVKQFIGDVPYGLITELVKDVEIDFENNAIPEYIMTELVKLPERARKMEYAWKLIEIRYQALQKFIEKDKINMVISMVVALFNATGIFKHKQ